jgi:hypothetical protein
MFSVIFPCKKMRDLCTERVKPLSSISKVVLAKVLYTHTFKAAFSSASFTLLRNESQG